MIKHTSGKLNNVFDALSRVNFIMQEIRVTVVGFKQMVDMYKDDAEFKDFCSCTKSNIS